MFRMLLNPAGYKYLHDLDGFQVGRIFDLLVLRLYFFFLPMSVRNFVELLLQLKCEGRN